MQKKTLSIVSVCLNVCLSVCHNASGRGKKRPIDIYQRACTF